MIALLRIVLNEIRDLRKAIQSPQKRLLTVERAYYLGITDKSIRNGLGAKVLKPFPVKPIPLGG